MANSTDNIASILKETTKIFGMLEAIRNISTAFEEAENTIPQIQTMPSHETKALSEMNQCTQGISEDEILFQKAINDENLEDLKQILLRNNKLINRTAYHTKEYMNSPPYITPLYLAVLKLNPQMTTYLLKNNADPNFENGIILRYAAVISIWREQDKGRDGNTKAALENVEILLKYKANPNITPPSDGELLIYEVLHPFGIEKSFDVLKLLLYSGADLTVTSNYWYHNSLLVEKHGELKNVTPLIACLSNEFNKRQSALELILNRIKELAQKEVQFHYPENYYKKILMQFLLKFVGNPNDQKLKQVAIEIIINHVFEPLVQERETRITFLMGLNNRLGGESPIRTALKQNALYEPKLIKFIFDLSTESIQPTSHPDLNSKSKCCKV